MSATVPSLPPLPSEPLEVAVAQLNAQDDVQANLATIASLVARASKRGAQLVSLPEGCASLGNTEKKRANAEPAPTLGDAPTVGLALTTLSALARTHRVAIAAGGLAIASSDPARPYNAHVVFDAEGTTRAVYRKLHLFDVDLPDGTTLRESDSSSAGEPSSDLLTVDIGGWRLGLTICYDLRFPELFRALVDRGAHALLVPSAFTVPTGKDHWHVLMRARAIESQCYVAAAAQWGRHPEGRLTYGKSLIADPWGDVIAQASDGVGIALATLDPKRITDVRAQLPSLRHRRLR
jgi:predicted amidohydrolase